MEALFQIVGCVLSSKPAPRRIDDFVAQVRRERAVVTAKDARGATFVRFNAPDARLVTMACEAVLGQSPSTLRFGFASGIKEAAEPGQDGLSISHRSIAQASDLAAGARDGEVLVSPQLASLLEESGLSFDSKEVHLQGGRVVPACLLDLSRGRVEKSKPVGRPAAQGPVQERLPSIDALDARVNALQQSAADAERRLAEVLARHGEIDDLRKRCDTLATQWAEAQQRLGEMADLHERLLPLTSQVAALLESMQTLESRRQTGEEVRSGANTITHMLGDVNLKLEMLSEQRAAVDHVGEQLARLDYTVQEAQNTLRALQREREVAERVEQGIKALRHREGAPKLI